MNRRWRLAQALEIRWWRRYLRRREPADYLDRKRAYWRGVLSRSGLRLAPGERVLDAGCGPAGIFMILEEQKVDALDPLLDAYAAGLAHFDPEAYPWVRFQSGMLESFPAVEPYDVVFCLNAINHVADLERSLDRLVAALKPGGMLVLSVDVHRCRALKWVFRAAPGDVLHPHQHALPDYLDRLGRRACRIEHVERLRAGRIFDYYLIVARGKTG